MINMLQTLCVVFAGATQNVQLIEVTCICGRDVVDIYFGAGKTSGGNVLRVSGRFYVVLVLRSLSLNCDELKEQFAMVGLPGHLLC